jgi:hypothetical protein
VSTRSGLVQCGSQVDAWILPDHSRG